ncbi:MAG: hypothetical protein KQH59_00580 [Desulfobulbaceae bacterium]|nr:hypothetical protein [Desulfofustis glycolicus]MCB2214537.1 hypothetical protein [Desulfobulbaceae bacterium]
MACLLGYGSVVKPLFSTIIHVRKGQAFFFTATIMSKGGKSAKKKEVVAVARKLAVLLHRLWKNEEEYKPLYKPQLEGLAIVS